MSLAQVCLDIGKSLSEARHGVGDIASIQELAASVVDFSEEEQSVG